ncbi:MAG: hypothetical protein VX800_03130 [Chloroflexota bacterium]|nr:hypothetical protein [Chloroflexota bacterium]
MTQLEISRIGEVVQASSTEITVHCYKLYSAASLGALVRTPSDDSQIYAIVRNIMTSPIDPARQPVARGSDEQTEDAVYLANPQLAKLLRTEFQAIIVGHKANSAIRHYLPSAPPRIHSFISICDEKEIDEFTESLNFLSLLLTGPTPLADEVTAAFLRQASATQRDPRAFLVTAGQELARTLSRDLQRLTSILRSIEP